MADGARIGFLHTAQVHVATFGALVHELAPDVEAVHVVDESLLADARAHGLDDPGLSERLARRLADLAADGADVVVCTCSTVSGVAEAVAGAVPVLRVDRPMAARAVAVAGSGSGPGSGSASGRVAVVAAVASTVPPTRQLLAEESARARVAVELVEVLCEDDWPLFETGDLDGYLDAVAGCVSAVLASDDVDVVVLAQASMAPVASRFAHSPVPVLSSPRAAVVAALELL